ncbi:beta-galactosidase [Chryseobacterium wanjuense]
MSSFVLSPYVCAEWEFGGYPWWLQNIKGLKIREDNEQFLERNRQYLSQLYNQVKDLQITKGDVDYHGTGRKRIWTFCISAKRYF